jgi:gluconolactonase
MATALFFLPWAFLTQGGGMRNVKKRSIIFLAIVAAGVAAAAQAQESGPIVRLDTALDAIVQPGAKVEKLAGGFGFTEGPVWVSKGGYLLFSDIPGNVINKWDPKGGKVSVLLARSGTSGRTGTPANPQNGNGSNGLTLDRQGRVVLCARGDRQVERIEKDGRLSMVASEYEGKRLNMPNDVVMKSDGAIYFTDPRGTGSDVPYEISYSGVYMLKNGKLTLLIQDMTVPNGLAFSPGEKYLYVNDSNKKTILKYDIKPDGTVANRQVFIDMSADKRQGNPDGMKVDHKGNVYCTGPTGIWVMSPEGKHLGTIIFPEQPANLAFGDADGKTLYATARTGLYRIRLQIPGIRP